MTITVHVVVVFLHIYGIYCIRQERDGSCFVFDIFDIDVLKLKVYAVAGYSLYP